MRGEPFLSGLHEKVPRSARGTIPVGFNGPNITVPRNARESLLLYSIVQYKQLKFLVFFSAWHDTQRNINQPKQLKSTHVSQHVMELFGQNEP